MLKQMKTKNLNETQNLTAEELKEFREVYESYQKAVYDLGLLDLEIENTTLHLNTLNEERKNQFNHINLINGKQQEIGNKLGDKYGIKQVNLETGELN